MNILPKHHISQKYRGFVLEETDRDGIVTIWKPVPGGRKIVAQYGKPNGTHEDRITAWDNAREWVDSQSRDMQPAYKPSGMQDHWDGLD